MFGMKFNIFKQNNWYTRRYKSEVANFFNFILIIISWNLLLIPLQIDGIKLISTPIAVILVVLFCCPLIHFWSFHFGKNHFWIFFQSILVLLVISGFFNGISISLINGFATGSSTVRFIGSVIAAILLGIGLINKQIRINNHQTTIDSTNQSRNFSLSWWSIIIFFHIMLLCFDAGIWLHPLNTWQLTVKGSLIGIYAGLIEEILVRGLILNVLLKLYRNEKNGVWKALVLQGIIFGLAHISGVFAGESVLTSIAIAIDVSAMGVLWGVIYLITKRLWIVILLHSLWDIGESLISQESNLSIPGILGIVVALFVSGSFITIAKYLFAKYYLSMEKGND
ncbi:hypothetical protein FC19_GL001070 [Liquorilactobacillus aquaticus DSM 21051]|uniref:CAAX prenyl protease 2/Lysostaphin resistance protein A-like domain-containing protein n=1 Tax=Liquorilactobacillus aquaticus DSM 21051 TaxID=1423725 RepID=A0A0R2CX40_9LACO|nr:hypothetical protein FC19_GL001070 [Liquorilactobacillus aquaticus DSM 21051]